MGSMQTVYRIGALLRPMAGQLLFTLSLGLRSRSMNGASGVNLSTSEAVWLNICGYYSTSISTESRMDKRGS